MIKELTKKIIKEKKMKEIKRISNQKKKKV